MTCLSVQKNCWSLRCSWSIACRRCSNYILILDLTPGFNGLGKNNCKTRWLRWETFKCYDLVHLILEVMTFVLSLLYWQPLMSGTPALPVPVDDVPLPSYVWPPLLLPASQQMSRVADFASIPLPRESERNLQEADLKECGKRYCETSIKQPLHCVVSHGRWSFITGRKKNRFGDDHFT